MEFSFVYLFWFLFYALLSHLSSGLSFRRLFANSHTIKVPVTRRRGDLAARCRRRHLRRDAGCGYEPTISSRQMQRSNFPRRGRLEVLLEVSASRLASTRTLCAARRGVSLVLNFVGHSYI